MNIRDVEVSVFRIPTDRPEGDGTLAWDATTVIVVEAQSDGGHRGVGYSYVSGGGAEVIREKLAPEVIGLDVDEIGVAWQAMVRTVRNLGRPGVAAGAISAVDIALWDLKARSLGRPLFRLLGAYRHAVPIYGSGGFTTYSARELVQQLSGWVELGIPRVKMKIGLDRGQREDEDVARVGAVREAIGPEPELFVDANGAYGAKQAIRIARHLADVGVTYFEEPVSSDDLRNLAFVRANVTLDVAAGEYGYDAWYFRDMLAAGAVDILQADVTRCLGITGWLQAATLAYGHGIPFSAHTAPSVHAHVGCAAPQLSHVEYFHDHARIERMLFDGTLEPRDGYLAPDPSRPGLGLELKSAEADRWRAAA